MTTHDLDLLGHQRLSETLALVDTDAPADAIRTAMLEGRGFCRAGEAGRQMIAGFGVIGRGATREEAARSWVEGARAVLGRDEIPAAGPSRTTEGNQP